MKRKLFGIILTFSITLTLCIFPTFAAGVSFEDTSGHWAEEAISSVVEKGLFNGTSETTFSPDISITRGMFVTVLGRFAEGLNFKISGNSTFSDVGPKEYYTPYVAWAADKGIVRGTSATTFSPNDPITREQMCTLFVRFLQAVKYNVPAGAEKSFTDAASISDYAKTPVQQAVALGLIQGVSTPAGTAFKPQANATRAETATVFLRLDNLKGIHDLNPADPDPVNPDNPGGNTDPVNPPTPVDPTPVDPTPVDPPTEEEIALEAEIVGYLQTILYNYDNMEYIRTVDPVVKNCMKIITNSMKDAMKARQNGTFISREYVETTYADSIAQAKALYRTMTEEQKSQMDNVAVRLEQISHLEKVLDYFGLGGMV